MKLGYNDHPNLVAITEIEVQLGYNDHTNFVAITKIEVQLGCNDHPNLVGITEKKVNMYIVPNGKKLSGRCNRVRYKQVLLNVKKSH